MRIGLWGVLGCSSRVPEGYKRVSEQAGSTGLCGGGLQGGSRGVARRPTGFQVVVGVGLAMVEGRRDLTRSHRLTGGKCCGSQVRGHTPEDP